MPLSAIYEMPIFLHCFQYSMLIKVLIFDELITFLLWVHCESFHVYKSYWFCFGELSLSFVHFSMLLGRWCFSITLSCWNIMLRRRGNLSLVPSTKHITQSTQTGKWPLTIHLVTRRTKETLSLFKVISIEPTIRAGTQEVLNKYLLNF